MGMPITNGKRIISGGKLGIRPACCCVDTPPDPIEPGAACSVCSGITPLEMCVTFSGITILPCVDPTFEPGYIKGEIVDNNNGTENVVNPNGSYTLSNDGDVAPGDNCIWGAFLGVGSTTQSPPLYVRITQWLTADCSGPPNSIEYRQGPVVVLQALDFVPVEWRLRFYTGLGVAGTVGSFFEARLTETTPPLDETDCLDPGSFTDGTRPSPPTMLASGGVATVIPGPC